MSANIVTQIRNINSPQKLLDFLRKQTKDSLAAFDTNNDPLQNLDPAVHSLGYLFILNARFQRLDYTNLHEMQILVQQTDQFFQICDSDQIKLGRNELRRLAKEFANTTLRLNQPSVSVLALRRAVQISSNSAVELTPIHQIFVQQCVLAKTWNEALPVLEVDIEEYDREFNMSYRDHLLYFFYGALIYARLKNFERAIDFLTMVIATPGSLASAIQVEAYKKYLLLSLLVHGKVIPIPKSTSSAASRAFQYLAKPYDDLVVSYAHNLKAIRECVHINQVEFREDLNFGLVQMVVESYEKKKIQALRELFVTIRLEDVAKRLHIAEGGKENDVTQEEISRVHRVINSMIESGELRGTISEEPVIITFNETHTVPSRHELESLLSSVALVNKSLKDLNRKIGSSKPYLSRIQSGGGRVSPDLTDFDGPRPMRRGKTGGRGDTGKQTEGRGLGNFFGVGGKKKEENDAMMEDPEY